MGATDEGDTADVPFVVGTRLAEKQLLTSKITGKRR